MKMSLKLLTKIGLIISCSLLGVTSAFADTNGPRAANALKGPADPPSCATSNGRDFFNYLILNNVRWPDYYAPEIKVIDYYIPKGGQINSSIMKKKVTKVKRNKYQMPIIIWDNQWARRGHTQKNPQFLYVEINQSSTNFISVEYQGLTSPIIEGEMIENKNMEININKPHSSLLFEPYKNCWRLIEQHNYTNKIF